MTTIDKLDISVYDLYAKRTRMVEQINSQLRLNEASSIPPQLSILDIYPKMTELDLLLGTVPLNTPWAYFFPPKQFKFLRRSPFAFYRVSPSLGSLEEQAVCADKVANYTCRNPEEEKEKEAISACFVQIEKLNNWLGFIIGRVGQFLQG